jgi:DeoR family transcriptional regulator, glycerol-3-phosphate regulon repressor
MLAEERRGRILELIDEKGSASVAELHRSLKVSRETIRRDIARLAAENRLRKTHGGALSADHDEPVFAERMDVNIEGKRVIARAAAEMVPDGASVIIDFGTTMSCLADALARHHRLTVFTNDLHVANRLSARNNNRVLILGGELQGTEGATLGRDVTDMLSNYFADFGFVGAGTISHHPWLMDFSREAAEIRSHILAHSRTPVVLADHTKFNRIGPVRMPGLERVKHILTDRPLKEDMAKALAAVDAEIRVIEA